MSPQLYLGVSKKAHHRMGLGTYCSWSTSYDCLFYPHQPLADGIEHRLSAVIDVEFGKDIVDVVLDCFFADAKPLGDLLVRETLGDQGEHLLLAGGEAVEDEGLLTGWGGELAQYLLSESFSSVSAPIFCWGLRGNVLPPAH